MTTDLPVDLVTNWSRFQKLYQSTENVTVTVMSLQMIQYEDIDIIVM